MNLHEVYYPLTAAPFRRSESYQEVLPCQALRPYVRCFWGGEPVSEEVDPSSLITPDTCVDIIFRLDPISCQIDRTFCGIDLHSFSAPEAAPKSRPCTTFAIRFYAWTAAFFAEDSLCETKNGFFDADAHFPSLTKALTPLLWEAEDLSARATLAERYLLSHLRPQGCPPLVLEGIAQLLLHRGTLRTEALARELHISLRQLERLFHEYIGVSPKQLSSLVRYQYFWNDVLFQPDFQLQDAVFRYGFTDQAHLLREFKRFHTMTIPEARAYAWKHGVFLQDKPVTGC
ncbi:MAG: helix-turn-helix domain-containing protein [Candidatus Onthomonas sp.]